MNKEQYVTFEVAKLLKDNGFDWPCICYYDDDGIMHEALDYVRQNDGEDDDNDECLCPTQQMAMAWLREEYYIDVLPLVRHVNKFAGELPIKEYSCRIYDGEGNVRLSSRDWFRAYEKSIEEALEYALTNLF